VRVSVPNEFLVGEVQAIIHNEVGFPLRTVEHEKRHFVVACVDVSQVGELLDIDGSKLSGQVIQVHRAAYSMSGNKIFAFISASPASRARPGAQVHADRLPDGSRPVSRGASGPF
jgi:hypothetical protein